MRIFKKYQLLGLSFLFALSSAHALKLPLPADVISLNSAAGQTMLQDSHDKISYQPLIIQFTTEKDLTYCAVASSVMVLNALDIPAPIDPTHAPYPYFTQNDFFTPAVNHIATGDWVQHHGLTLDQAGAMLKTFPVKVTVVHADQITVAQFRNLAKQAVASHNEYVMVNVLRAGLGEVGGGHFSPLAAYDPKTDRFLFLDVARYKYPPVWITTQDLWNAMHTVDPVAKQYRGFLLIKK